MSVAGGGIQMGRTWHCFFWCALALCADAQVGWAGQLISPSAAGRVGLTRAWYAQIGALRATGPIAHINLDGGTLLVQSTSGLLTALHPETGRTLWATQVGPPNRLSSEPAANEENVVVLNGSVLYVLDHKTGKILFERKLRAAPGAGPGVSETHAFVPMVSGVVEGYTLDPEKAAKAAPWVYKSAGRVLIPPMTTGQSVSWTTDKGYFYVASPNAKGIRFRLETRGAIDARPAYWTPNLYAGSTDGSLYAVNEATGKIVWRHSVGDAIYASPIAIEDRVFVVSEVSGMYCLDAKAGQVIWNAPGIRTFVSISPSRVYAVDQLGRLAVLDSRHGARLSSLTLEGISVKYANYQTDRIYLVSDTCVVQCLHETGLKSPVTYVPPPPPVEEDESDKPKRPVSKPPKAPVEPVDAAAEEAGNEAMPAEPDNAEAPADDDPFKEPGA